MIGKESRLRAQHEPPMVAVRWHNRGTAGKSRLEICSRFPDDIGVCITLAAALQHVDQRPGPGAERHRRFLAIIVISLIPVAFELIMARRVPKADVPVA